MITLAELGQYELLVVVMLLFGVCAVILGVISIIRGSQKPKKLDQSDVVFYGLIIIIGILVSLLMGGVMLFGSITYESITPCNIIISEGGGLVATVEGGVYSAYPNELVKLYINQTQDVVVINNPISGYPSIKEVLGPNCPFGTAKGC